MELLPDIDLNKPENLYAAETGIVTETLLQIFKHNRLGKKYPDLPEKNPVIIINSLLDQLEVKYEIPESDFRNIPAEGAFLIISNHPYRGIDSMLLFKIIYEKRNDFKVMANQLLCNIEPLRDKILPVKVYKTRRDTDSSFIGIREGLTHLAEGHCLGIFPAGEGSVHFEGGNIILDKEWKPQALKFIKNAGVPIIPVYFHGTNSRLAQIVRTINPLLRLTKLPGEILNKTNRTVKIRIGSAISVKEQSEFKDLAKFGRYLRARTYSLGSSLEAGKFFSRSFMTKRQRVEPLASPAPADILIAEFEKIRSAYELFSTKNYSVVCAPTWAIPEIFNEIGRLRELTFRQVGEGTNKSTDIDEYDIYYNHLFIWDTDEKRIVGAYRIGKGKDIATIYNINGFYISSLFRIKKDFLPILQQSLELGRSFIVKEYQKKAIPLFLLWKGIMFYLLRNPEYRYLIGPVSISNEFSKFSKSLIVEFIRTYFYDEEKAAFIIPRKDFVVKPDVAIDRKIFIDVADHDINKIERIIMDIEPGYRIPVLLRKYLEINGMIIGFNIDPNFNDCLDGLLILDLYNTPPDYIKGLSRELNDDSILERFKLPVR